jgi:hypothetical protein
MNILCPRLIALGCLAIASPCALAGLHYSGESFAALPSQWRGFLLDQRHLRVLAVADKVNGPASPLLAEYRAHLIRLESKSDRSADDVADLGALYLRFGLNTQSLDLLRNAQRRFPDHFRIAANLGTAWHMNGDLAAAAESLRLAVRLAPPRLRAAEELHLQLVRVRSRLPKDSRPIDDLFGVRYVGENGEYVPGTLAAAERKKLPADAVALLQQLGLWLPADGRLLWQLGELASAHGDVSMAASIFDGCVSEFGLSDPDYRRRRQLMRVAADAVTKSAPAPEHERHLKIEFRSPRPIPRRFDMSSLPPIRADGINGLPFELLAETTLGREFKPNFPKYLRDLDGKRVSVSGFMQPLGASLELTAFLFIEYPVGCWFCEAPGPTGLLLVELPPGKAVTLRRAIVRVEGKLVLNATDPEDFLFSIKDAKVSDPD